MAYSEDTELNNLKTIADRLAIKYNTIYYVIKKEGCLTWLGRTILAERYPQIKVRYYNLKGQHIEREISGIEAQIFQHEYKHLMGVAEVIE